MMRNRWPRRSATIRWSTAPAPSATKCPVDGPPDRRPTFPIGTDRKIGLVWLVRLRWGALLCQIGALVVATSLFSMSLRGPVLVALVGALAVTNVALHVYSRSHAGTTGLIASVLIFDTLLLTGLLLSAGGAANPFTVLYLVNVTLGAILLPGRWTWLVVVLSVSGFASLFSVESGGHGHAMDHSGYGSHLQGMWIAYATAAAVIAYFVGRLSEALAKREVELALVREQAMKNERLAALTTLAAGAAHELNTPLSTVAVAASEIQRRCETLDPALAEDAKLIRSELKKCKDILAQMSAHAGETIGEARVDLEVRELVEMIRAGLGPEWSRVDLSRDGAPNRLSATPQALARVLVNLIKNALDASPADRRIVFRLTGESDAVHFEVVDRGSGMSPEIRTRACDPFFTTKAPGKGMGLGLFLVKSYAEGLGGSLEIESEPKRGTHVRLVIPQIERDHGVPATGGLIEGATS